MPRWSISPSWSSAKASHGSPVGIGPVDSPPLALRWSIVIQRKSFSKASGALKTAVGQLLTREFKPPGGDQEREAGASLLVADANLALLVKRHGNSSSRNAKSVDGVQYDHRDLALGLLLVIGVRRPELERLWPQPRALLASGGAGPCLELLGADLHVDFRVREEIAVPAGVLRRAALRGDHDIALADFPVIQREDELLSRFSAGRR